MTLNSTVPGEVAIGQAKFVSDLASQNPDLKLYDAHTSSSLMDAPSADHAPCDRDHCRSLVMSCMSTEINFGVCVLASFLLTATMSQYKRLARVIDYMASDPKHCGGASAGGASISDEEVGAS